jgi:hypothetical protein
VVLSLTKGAELGSELHQHWTGFGCVSQRRITSSAGAPGHMDRVADHSLQVGAGDREGDAAAHRLTAGVLTFVFDETSPLPVHW